MNDRIKNEDGNGSMSFAFQSRELWTKLFPMALALAAIVGFAGKAMFEDIHSIIVNDRTQEHRISVLEEELAALRPVIYQLRSTTQRLTTVLERIDKREARRDGE